MVCVYCNHDFSCGLRAQYLILVSLTSCTDVYICMHIFRLNVCHCHVAIIFQGSHNAYSLCCIISDFSLQGCVLLVDLLGWLGHVYVVCHPDHILCGIVYIKPVGNVARFLS